MKKFVIALLMVVSITFMTHSSVLNNGFVNEWDDYKYPQAPEARAGLTLENIKWIFSYEIVKRHYYFHPLTKLSFALEHELFGLNPKIFHFDNLLIHLANTALVFWVAYLLSAQLVTALLASLLFGIHPLQVETVAWLSTRKELLFVLFYLGSLIAYVYYCIRSKKRARFFILSFCFFVCSMLSKPAAATLPIALFILDFHFKRGFRRSVFLEKLPFVALSLSMAAFYFSISRSWEESTIYTSDYFSAWEKIAICLSTSAMYVYKLILPHKLSFAYLSPLKPDGVLALKYYLMAVFPVLALILLCKWTRRGGLYVTAGLFFFATIFLSSSGKTFMGDHYVYLPSLGFFLFLAAFLDDIINRRPAASAGRKGAVLILLIYLTVLSIASHERGKVWKDSMTLYNDALQKYPTQPVALLNRGKLYALDGQYQRAIEDHTLAIEGGYLQRSGMVTTLDTRAWLHARNGQYQEAINDLNRLAGIENNPKVANYANSSVRILSKLQDYAQSGCDPSTGENCTDGKTFRKELDEKFWAREVLAQEYEKIFIKLLDDMRTGTRKFKYLKKFPFKSITVPSIKNERRLELDIVAAEFSSDPKTYSKNEFIAALQHLEQERYRIEQLELHHEEFRYRSAEEASSVISFIFHVANDDMGKRLIFEGQIEVAWDSKKDWAGQFKPKTIDVIKLTSLEREARKAAFLKLFTIHSDQISGNGNNPVLVYDLDHDGLSEIILPALNLIVNNAGDGSFTEESLLEVPETYLNSAFIGELTGDDDVDLLVTRSYGSPLLFKGTRGYFAPTPSPINIQTEPRDYPASTNAITAGDIDRDGDLDIFLGRYKFSHLMGLPLPTPYFDANDGEPSFLLENDGHGNFTDITVKAGLGEKRFRRTQSASFVDLDEDQNLDLLIVSDFSGVDVYRNNGNGTFEDITERAVDERSSFGSSHTFGDFDRDGHLDLFVTGRSSTAARRLNKMGVSLKGFENLQEMMMPMAYGNRLYYGQGQPGVFRSAANNDQIARSGWGWGAANFDLDNDGDAEIYVANGNLSKDSALDYDTYYWRNDIFMGRRPAELSDLEDLFGRRSSWSGFEHNALYLNDSGKAYDNVAYLMGLAFEFDSRSVVTDDINMDGRIDLIVSDRKGNVYGLLNAVKTDNHWVGVILQERDQASPLGAVVTVSTADGKKKWHVMSGESFISQHPYKKVFGLKKDAKIEYIEVRWPDGRSHRLDQPAADRYHKIVPPQ